MTDKSELPKIYCYAEDVPGQDARRYLATNEAGQLITATEALDENSGQHDLRNSLLAASITSLRYQIEWVAQPRLHPGLQSALARTQGASAPGPSRPSALALRALQAEQHLCPSCGHAGVCALAREITALATLTPTLSQCGGYEPPLPAELLVAAEQLREA